MPDSADLVGKVLGSCTLERVIGRGGMSTVYLAHQKRPARQVAVKVLQPHYRSISKEAYVKRFQREADIVARLEHINIIPLYEYGEQDEFTYLVMPYIPGGSLEQLLANNGKLSIRQAYFYLSQVANALDYARVHNVIHRDLKPSNLLLHTDGRLVLADFGIARFSFYQGQEESSLTVGGSFLGTPAYMSPELALSQPVDHRSDIYQLGIVLYEMLTGDIPFQGETYYAIAQKHLFEALPSVYAIDQSIPAIVDEVLAKATAKEPEKRFASAGAFANAFRGAITPDQYYVTRPSLPALPAIKLPSITQSQLPVAVHEESTQPLHPASTHSMPGVSLSQPPLKPQNIETPMTATRPSWYQTKSFWLKMIPVVLLLLIGIFICAQVVINIGNENSASGKARRVVEQYYDHLNKREYQAAYNLLSPGFQKSISFQQFALGYANTKKSTITVDQVIEQSPDQVVVSISIVTEEIVSAKPIQKNYIWIGMIKKQADGSWKINSASILPQTSTFFRVPIALAT